MINNVSNRDLIFQEERAYHKERNKEFYGMMRPMLNTFTLPPKRYQM